MKRYAPATQRNREPIAKVLETELPASGTVLEIASGSGEHALYFAERFAHVTWVPSDRESDALASIAAYREESELPNLAAPLELSADQPDWPIDHADAIFCANMIHISPWSATNGLLAGAGKVLSEGAPLILYGPFVEEGRETAPSNLDFDRSLKARDPEWGLRSLQVVAALAEKAGLLRSARYEMPANNLIVVFRRG